jgi:hypothetical protein
MCILPYHYLLKKGLTAAGVGSADEGGISGLKWG